MKSKHILIGLLVLSMVTFAYISTVLAADYYPINNISKGGAVWQFDTKGMFSSKDITSIKAEYWKTIENGDGTTTTTYYDMTLLAHSQLTNNQVKLTFDSAFLPDYANGTRVTGTLADGKTFLATGPGFAWGGIR